MSLIRSIISTLGHNIVTGGGGGTIPPGNYTPLGKVFTDFTNASKWTVAGSNTWTFIPGTKINVVGGGGGYATYIQLDSYGPTNLKKFRLYAKIKPLTLGYGFCAQILHVRSNYNMQPVVNFQSGTCWWEANNTIGQQKAMAGTFTASTSTVYEYVFDYNEGQYTFTLKDAGTGTVLITDTFFENAGVSGQNCFMWEGFIRLTNLSGGFDITDFYYEAEASIMQNPYAVCVGDSKTGGDAVGGGANVYTDLLATDKAVPVVNMGSSSDSTNNILARIAEIKLFSPQYFTVFMGRNDILQDSRTSAAWQADYQSIVTQLEAIAPVYHILSTPESTGTLTALNSWIQSTYPSARIIDTVTGWNSATMLYSDGIHPNNAGHVFIKNQIKAVLPT